MRWIVVLLAQACSSNTGGHCKLICEDRVEIAAHAAVYVEPNPYATLEVCIAHVCGTGHYNGYGDTIAVTGAIIATGGIERSTPDGGLDLWLVSTGSAGSLGLVDGDIYTIDLDDHIAVDLAGASAPVTYRVSQPCESETCSIATVQLVLVEQ